MPLPIPNLDDRDFDQLVNAAIAKISKDLNTDWSDLSPGDPGIVLLEAFAYLTEQMIYRVNRLPRKVYIAFLRMLGVTLIPPTSARVLLSFWHTTKDQPSFTLPAGSQVTTAEGSDKDTRPVFITIEDLVIKPNQASEKKAANVMAYHCEYVEEALGRSKGKSGQVFKLRHSPLIAPTGESYLDLKVGVQISQAEAGVSDAKGKDGQKYRIWKEVDSFYGLTDTDQVYIVDRQAGLIQFAPEARMSGEPVGVLNPAVKAKGGVNPLAAVPPEGQMIRVWYAHGGGEAGNVPKRMLTKLLPVVGSAHTQTINVINLEPARGGFDAETLENALVRGPQEIYAQRRAVTAHEFELAALGAGDIARARAIPAAELWENAVPGTVNLALVPRLTKKQPVSIQSLRENENPDSLQKVKDYLAERTPLGIRTNLNWVRYKQIQITANITCGKNEAKEIADRLRQRLNQMLSPLAVESSQDDPQGRSTGWRFGQSLRVADIYNAILMSEPTPLIINSLDLAIEHAPEKEIRSLAADFFQKQTWYAGSDQNLFRSTNDGAGWELVLQLEPGSFIPVQRYRDGDWQPEAIKTAEIVRHVRPNPSRAGLLAVTSQYVADGKVQSSLFFSLDCGEKWYARDVFHDLEIEDAAWLQRGDQHVLLLATDRGLLEVNLTINAVGRPDQTEIVTIPVLPKQPDYPLYAVSVLRGSQGNLRVAVALKSRRGVFLSSGAHLSRLEGPAEADPTSSFSPLEGLRDQDVRHLNVQYLDDRFCLWAGVMALADIGKGCYRWQFGLNGRMLDTGEGWVSGQWNGGSCLGLAFQKQHVFAITAWGGLMHAEASQTQSDLPPNWESLEYEDLPRRRNELEKVHGRRDLFEPIHSIASNGAAASPLLMLGSSSGIYRRRKQGGKIEIEKISRRTLSHLRDVVTIPPDWLLVSGEHSIIVEEADSTNHPHSQAKASAA